MATQVRPRGQRGGHLGGAPGESRATARRNGKKEKKIPPDPNPLTFNESAPILASTEWNGVYWELYGFAALLFFITCYGISQYSQWLERQLRTDHR